jgi:hypothetical protein
VFKGKYLVLRGQKQLNDQTLPNELVLSPFDDLKRNEFTDGSYKLAYSTFNDVVGNDEGDNQLIITQISPSRTEIKCIPKFLKNDDRGTQINKDFRNFSVGTVTTKNVLPFVQSQLDSANFQAIIDDIRQKDEEAAIEIERVKSKYSFNDDVAFVRDLDFFFADIFTGTIDTLFTLYEESIEVSRISAEYNKWISFVLRNAQRFVVQPEDVPEVEKDIEVYRKILNGALDIESIPNFNNKEQNYLKNVMNLGGNVIFPILTWFSSTENQGDPIQHSPLVLKLNEPLPTNFGTKTEFWISNNSISEPSVQSFDFESEEEIEMRTIRGANFDMDVGVSKTITQPQTLSELISTGSEVSSELSRIFKKEFQVEETNANYNDFSTFVHFSSARQRIDNFIFKLSCVSDLDNRIETLQSESVSISNPSLKSAFISAEIVPLQEEKEHIITNFTGYEDWLYYSEDSGSFPKQQKVPIEFDDKVGGFVPLNNQFFLEPYPIPSDINNVDPQIQSWYQINADKAILYDKINDNWMVNNTPEWIRKNEDNEQYLRFLNMVGEHFDIIWEYIGAMNAVRKPENRPEDGISQALVSTMLQSLGFCSFNGTAEQDLSLTLLGVDSQGNTIEEIPGRERTRLIWRRLLNNLPYIYKTKGTEESIRAVLAAYGIPDHLLLVKEYAGIQASDEPSEGAQFIFDDVNYELKISGSSYLYFDYSASLPQSIEFKVRFDEDKIEEDDYYWPLVQTDHWVLGVERIKGCWGRFKFEIDAVDTASFDSSKLYCPRVPSNWEFRDFLVTQSMYPGDIPLGSISGSLENEINEGLVLPLFTGKPFNVLLRKDDVADFYMECQDDPNFANRVYNIFIKSADQGNILFDVKSNFSLGPSYNYNFESSSQIYFGNYVSSSFVGTMDQIRIYNSELDEKRFENHALFSKAYDVDQEVFDETLEIKDFNTPLDSLVVELNLDAPVDLYANPTQSNGINIQTPFVEEIYFENFPSGSSFPYSFDRVYGREVVNLPNLGSEVFSNFKVRHRNQTLISKLSPITRSTRKSSDIDPLDTEKLGVFFSPVDVINNQIIRFLGNINLGDFIGDPDDLYKTQYKNFEALRKIFFSAGFGRLDFQEYINLVKAHFDKSLFPTIEKLVPARCRYLRGLLIEPTILERNKIERKPVVREIHNNYSGSIEGIDKYDDVTSDIVNIQQDKLIVSGTNFVGEDWIGRFEDRTRTEIDLDQIRNKISPSRDSNYSNEYRYGIFDDEDVEAYGTLANCGMFWDGNQFIKVELIPSERERTVPISNDTRPSEVDVVLSADIEGNVNGNFDCSIDAQFDGFVLGTAFYNGNVITGAINDRLEGKFSGKLNGSIDGFIYDGTIDIVLEGNLNEKPPIPPATQWIVNDDIQNFGQRRRPIITEPQDIDKGIEFVQETKNYNTLNFVCAPATVDVPFTITGSFQINEDIHDGVIKKSGSIEVPYSQKLYNLPFGKTNIEGSYDESEIPTAVGSVFVQYGPDSPYLDNVIASPFTSAQYKYSIIVTHTYPFAHYLVNHIGNSEYELLHGYMLQHKKNHSPQKAMISSNTVNTTINDESKLEEGKLPIERTRLITERELYPNGSDDYHWFSNTNHIKESSYFYLWPERFIKQISSGIESAGFTGSRFTGTVSEI